MKNDYISSTFLYGSTIDCEVVFSINVNNERSVVNLCTDSMNNSKMLFLLDAETQQLCKTYPMDQQKLTSLVVLTTDFPSSDKIA